MNNEWELLLWIPDHDAIIYVQDGSGDQLLSEDYKNRHNDYIDYKISELNDDNAFEEGDGGLYLYNNKNVNNWQDKIEECICYALGLESCPAYVKLRMRR